MEYGMKPFSHRLGPTGETILIQESNFHECSSNKGQARFGFPMNTSKASYLASAQTQSASMLYTLKRVFKKFYDLVRFMDV
jgi:hypothetical protein